MERTSYAKDIRPLFTQRDIDGMKKGFNLASYDEVKAHAAAIHDRMPVVIAPEAFDLWLDCARVDALTAAKWMADGCQP